MLKVMARVRDRLNIGTEESDDFVYLGSHLKCLPMKISDPNGPWGIRLVQSTYCDMIEVRVISRPRGQNELASVTNQEYEEYRTDLGQVTWVAGVTAPYSAYDSSTLSRPVNNLQVRHLKLLKKLRLKRMRRN